MISTLIYGCTHSSGYMKDHPVALLLMLPCPDHKTVQFAMLEKPLWLCDPVQWQEQGSFKPHMHCDVTLLIIAGSTDSPHVTSASTTDSTWSQCCDKPSSSVILHDVTHIGQCMVWPLS